MMSSSTPPFAPLWAGIRPSLRMMKDHHAGLVYMYLLTRLDGRTGQCNPSVPTIAGELGIDERSVRDAKALLRRLGVLDWTRQHGKPDNFIFPTLDIRQVGACHVPTPHEGTCDVGTSDATQVGACHVPQVGASHAPQRRIQEEESKEEDRAFGSGDPAGRSTSPASDDPAAGTSPASASKRDEVIRAVTSDKSGVALAAWLLHGADAIGKPPEAWKSLRPGRAHWAAKSRDTTRTDPDCKASQLAGYVAYKLAGARVADGQPIVMPDLAKLGRVVKTLRERMTQDELVGHIDRITANWPSIKAALHWMDTPPPLDELLLHNSHVMDLSRRLAAGQNIATPQQPQQTNTLADPRKDPKYGHLIT